MPNEVVDNELPIDNSNPTILDNSEVVQSIDKILDFLKQEKEEQIKKEQEIIKSEQEQKKKDKIKEKEDLKKQEEKEKNEKEFLENIKTLTYNSSISFQVEQNQLLLEKLDEQILVSKISISLFSVIIAILLIKIFASSFKK